MALVNPRFKVESRSPLIYMLIVDCSDMDLYWPEASHNGLLPQAIMAALRPIPSHTISSNYKHIKTIIACQYTYNLASQLSPI